MKGVGERKQERVKGEGRGRRKGVGWKRERERERETERQRERERKIENVKKSFELRLMLRGCANMKKKQRPEPMCRSQYH